MIVINDTTTNNNSNDDDDDDDDDDLEAAHPHSRSWSNIPVRIGSGKPWFSRTGEKRSNQQQTQLTYDMSLSHCKSYLPK